MRCLYEVLSVDKTADDDTIKKAYRKAALIWHPGLHLSLSTFCMPSEGIRCQQKQRQQQVTVMTAAAAAVRQLQLHSTPCFFLPEYACWMAEVQ
jgi:hypothetical protein